MRKQSLVAWLAGTQACTSQVLAVHDFINLPLYLATSRQGDSTGPRFGGVE